MSTVSSVTGQSPLKRVWDGLEREECDPRGRDHEFRSTCPVHKGDSNLSVSEGSDGRVLITCFSHQCTYREVMNAIGLEESDGFPDGHRNARPDNRWRPHIDATQALLNSINLAKLRWARTTNENFYWVQECPNCQCPRMWVNRVDKRRYQLSCQNGCESETIRLAIDRKALAV